MLRLALVTLLVAISAPAFSCNDASPLPFPTSEPTGAVVLLAPTPPQIVEVRIHDFAIQAETAVSEEQRGQGLSDRPFLAKNAGMLFFMPEERIPGFHMRNMQFPLDFIWISAQGLVVDVTENVPHPAAAGGETLAGISPAVPVLYVLEVNAGTIKAADIRVGDSVQFDPDVRNGQDQ